jgi:hypothetical protein
MAVALREITFEAPDRDALVPNAFEGDKIPAVN